MNRSLITVAAAIVAFAGSLAAQAVTVVGTGDPKVDIPAVQDAVNQGGRVILLGHFSFDAPPTVAEFPNGAEIGPTFGNILVSKAVAISGTRDDQGEMTSIDGGTNPFYVEAPGAHVAIQGLRFTHSKAPGAVIRVVAARGLAITSNRIEGEIRSASGVTGAIEVGAVAVAADASHPLQPENVSGTLWIANNDIDMQGTAGANSLGISIFSVGKSPDQEVDLYVSGNNIRNMTGRAIVVAGAGGRVSIERNVIATAAFPRSKPCVQAGDSSGVVSNSGESGSYLVAHNTIDCAWASRGARGIWLDGVSRAIVVDNDLAMSPAEGMMPDVTNAAIEVRGGGGANMVLNNRIRGHANFALSVAAGAQGATFIMNDVQGFTSVQADLFIDASGTNTIAVGGLGKVEDRGTGTVIVLAR